MSTWKDMQGDKYGDNFIPIICLGLDDSTCPCGILPP